jgi:hypothetical protein
MRAKRHTWIWAAMQNPGFGVAQSGLRLLSVPGLERVRAARSRWLSMGQICASTLHSDFDPLSFSPEPSGTKTGRIASTGQILCKAIGVRHQSKTRNVEGYLMAARMACCPGRRIIHGGFCLAAIVMLAAMASQGVVAQTLTAPKSPPPPVTAKSSSAERMKSCSAYGAGFVQIPGSDACVKIGGFVTMEGTAR